MNVDDYIQAECDRQRTTNVVEMKKAFNYAESIKIVPVPLSLGKHFQTIANLVEPEINTWRLCGYRYVTFRSSHVGFMNGGSAAPAAEVPERFSRLMELYDETMNKMEIDLWVKSLLDIHPWADGNGRTASIVRNWMLATMNNPTQLPFYYGE